jgi:hypothetical protein
MTLIEDRDIRIWVGRRRVAWTRSLTVFGAVALGACGNITAGGIGEAEVYMSGDATQSTMPSTPSPAAVGSAKGFMVPPLLAIVGAGLEGDVEVRASFALRAENGAIVPLTPDGPITAIVDLGGVQQPRVARQVVPAGSYNALTLHFTEVAADVTGGLEIGGVPFVGTVTVDIGTGLEVTRQVDLIVDDEGLVDLLVDLHVAEWVPLLDVLTGTVSAQDFSTAVVVTVR